MKLLEYEELQRMVDYSFGDHSGVLGGVPNAYMKKANINNIEFVNFINNTNKEKITLFIDNIRLYRRPIHFSDWELKKPIKPHDLDWLKQFDDEDLLELCSKFPEKQFIIFTAFEDTPLDPFIEGKIPENVLSINATNSVHLNDKIDWSCVKHVADVLWYKFCVDFESNDELQNMDEFDHGGEDPLEWDVDDVEEVDNAE